MTPDLDAESWVRRWDRQQAGYVPDRAETFSLMFDIIEHLDATPGRLLDLACGPGSLAAMAIERFPDSHVVGVDLDPVLVELGRRTLGERVEWVEADLREPGWTGQLDGPAFDAVVSATALHWLDAEYWPALTAGLAARMRPGGVFIDYDTLLADPGNPRLAEVTETVRRERTERTFAEFQVEDFAAWWTAIAEEPALRTLVAERDRRFGSRRHGAGTTLTQVERWLREAGFTEVATLTQYADRRLVVAIR